jgi:hypothetical protein
MANAHNPMPGKGVLYTQLNKKHEKAPDLRGQLMLAEDAKAGDIIKIGGWRRQTSVGELISLAQDLYVPPDRNQTQYPVEVNAEPSGSVYPTEANSGPNEDEVPF